MGIQLGSPYIPPDNSTLSVNSSGQMGIKPGTAGDVLVAGALGVWAPVAVGNNGEFLGVVAGAPAWTNSPGEGWTLIETLNPSGAASATTTGTITVYDEYLLIGTQLIGSASTNLKGRINADTGNNYATNYLFGTAPTLQTAQPNFEIDGIDTASFAKFTMRVDGKTSATASGKLSGILDTSGCNGNNVRGLGMRWTGGNATQITSFTVLPASGTFSGKIEVFGRTRNA